LLRDADYDDPLRDDEFPDDESDRENDGTDVVPCPHCGREVAEDAPRCPHCGDWITTQAGSGGRRWVWAAAAIGLVMVILLYWR
jgi:hypothetical protein